MWGPSVVMWLSGSDSGEKPWEARGAALNYVSFRGEPFGVQRVADHSSRVDNIPIESQHVVIII